MRRVFVTAVQLRNVLGNNYHLPTAWRARKPIRSGKVMTTNSGHRFSIKPWLRWGNHEGPFNMTVTPITATSISSWSQWLFYFPPVAASSPRWSLLPQLSCSEDPLSPVIHGWDSALWDRSFAPVIYHPRPLPIAAVSRLLLQGQRTQPLVSQIHLLTGTGLLSHKTFHPVNEGSMKHVK